MVALAALMGEPLEAWVMAVESTSALTFLNPDNATFDVADFHEAVVKRVISLVNVLSLER